MGKKLIELVNTPAKMQQFRRDHRIPAGVRLKVPDGNVLRDYDQTEEKIHIPILFITECGLKFPLDPFLVEVCDRCRLNTMQICPNFVRVVLGVVALNRVLEFNLGWHDVLRLYSVVPTADGDYYLKARKKEQQLITDLPSSSKGKQDDFLIVSGNWKPKTPEGDDIQWSIPIPRGTGPPSNLSASWRLDHNRLHRDQIAAALIFDGFDPTPVGLGRAAHVFLNYTPSYWGGVRRNGEARTRRPWPPAPTILPSTPAELRGPRVRRRNVLGGGAQRPRARSSNAEQ